MIDPIVLSSITAAVSLLGDEFAKGVASEAGKTTWASIKALFGWRSDPPAAEIPEKVAITLVASPETVAKLFHLLKQDQVGAASSLVGRLEVHDGKVIVAHSIQNLMM